MFRAPRHPLAGHPGKANTYEHLHRNYDWRDMEGFVRRYVHYCHTCKRSNSYRFAKQVVLEPLSVPEQRWRDISVDFVTGATEVDGKDAICNVVDRLTKERHHIATTNLDADGLAELFVHHVGKHHGLPRSVISDRGPQFISQSWTHLCSRLGYQAKLSTAYYPKTDGQTERVNGVMEQRLRVYVNYMQDDWIKWLHLAGFVGNNMVSETTKVSSFFTNRRTGLESTDPPVTPAQIEAESFALKMNELQEYLSNHNLQTRRPCRKLENRRIGPYRVSNIVSPSAVQLDLPPDVKIHNVFNVNFLKRALREADLEISTQVVRLLTKTAVKIEPKISQPLHIQSKRQQKRNLDRHP